MHNSSIATIGLRPPDDVGRQRCVRFGLPVIREELVAEPRIASAMRLALKTSVTNPINEWSWRLSAIENRSLSPLWQLEF
jgi:hypothetical protein